jgi:hypothetical protein
VKSENHWIPTYNFAESKNVWMHPMIPTCQGALEPMDASFLGTCAETEIKISFWEARVGKEQRITGEGAKEPSKGNLPSRFFPSSWELPKMVTLG